MSSLARAARNLRPADHNMRFGLLMAGSAVAIGAVYTEMWFILLPAGIMVGYAFRPEADRYYMEGFSDGVETGASLADERNTARVVDGGTGLRPDEPGAAVRGIDPHQLPAGAPDPVGRFSRPVAVPEPGSRPARPSVTEDGRPIPAIGPRAPAFPEVAARGTRSVDLRAQDRPKAGSQAGQGISSEEG